jgi:hypothetical protein
MLKTVGAASSTRALPLIIFFLLPRTWFLFTSQYNVVTNHVFVRFKASTLPVIATELEVDPLEGLVKLQRGLWILEDKGFGGQRICTSAPT